MSWQLVPVGPNDLQVHIPATPETTKQISDLYLLNKLCMNRWTSTFQPRRQAIILIPLYLKQIIYAKCKRYLRNIQMQLKINQHLITDTYVNRYNEQEVPAPPLHLPSAQPHSTEQLIGRRTMPLNMLMELTPENHMVQPTSISMKI